MPSLAIPAAVVAAVPAASIASTGQSTGNAASGASAAASAGDATGGGAFADLLNRQMTSATTPADPTVAALTATSDEPEAVSADSSSQPVDLSLLLQGLLLPNSAGNPVARTGDLKTVASEASGGRATQPALPGAAFGETSIQLAAESSAGLPASGGDALDFAELIPLPTKLAASDAAIAGKPAESAARELPQQTGQTDMQPVAHMFAHQSLEAGKVERESLVVPTPVTSPNWHEDLGNKVSMLIGKEATSAELVLTPPHLGRVEVQLTVSGDQTNATFVAATPAARDALEQALPKLREFLADAGINLAQASVGGDAQAGQGNNGGQRGGRSGSGGDAGASEIAPPAAWTRRVDGMVDTFA